MDSKCTSGWISIQFELNDFTSQETSDLAFTLRTIPVFSESPRFDLFPSVCGTPTFANLGILVHAAESSLQNLFAPGALQALSLTSPGIFPTAVWILCTSPESQKL